MALVREGKVVFKMDMESKEGSRGQELERVDQCCMGWGCRLAGCECVVFPRVKHSRVKTPWCLGACMLGILGSCVFLWFSKTCGKMSPALQAGCIQKKKNCLLSRPVSFSVFSPPRFGLFGIRKTCCIMKGLFLLIERRRRVGWPSWWLHSLMYVWALKRVAYIHTAVYMTYFFHTWYLVFSCGNILVLPIALH